MSGDGKQLFLWRRKLVLKRTNFHFLETFFERDRLEADEIFFWENGVKQGVLHIAGFPVSTILVHDRIKSQSGIIF